MSHLEYNVATILIKKLKNQRTRKLEKVFANTTIITWILGVKYINFPVFSNQFH